MKVLIWVHKRDIDSGKITDWYNICPQQSRWMDWYQIEISQDEFAQLQDRKTGRSTDDYTYPEFVDKHYKK